MSLGSDIVTALSNLTGDDRFDINKIWEAIGDEIQKSIFDWDSTITYSQNDFVSYVGKLYKSLQNSNLNKQPSTQPTWWEEYPQITDIPVGTVWMFDGTNWVDNSTIAGWYACIAANVGQGCTDMVNRFVMGKVVAGGGSTGGSNSITIISAMLPTHTHAIDHDHPVKTSAGPSVADTGTQSASHSHTTDIGSHGHNLSSNWHPSAGSSDYALNNLCSVGANHGVPSWCTPQPSYYRANSTTIGNKGSGIQSASHSHSMQSHTHEVNLDNFTGSSGDGGFANTAFDNKPAYYSIIFIRKCA
jgi:hypothetical protein